jgi:lysophospholipase L1-like esterase
MKKPKPIVAFGDSITRGHSLPEPQTWVFQLAQALNQKLGDSAPQVVNAGTNGHSSRQALGRIQADVLDKSPSWVLVEFGGNDAGHPPLQYPERHVPLEEFRTNMRAIHDKIAAIGGHVAFVVFPPVLDEQHPSGKSPEFAPFGGMDAFVEIYRQATRQLALDLKRPIFDLDLFVRTQARTHGFKELIKPDGIHLTIKCNQMVAQAMTPLVLQWLETSHEA